MGLFGRNKRDPEDLEIFETHDKLVVYNEDDKTCDIEPVTGITDTHIMAVGKHSIPREDLSVHVSDIGRVYTYRAPAKIIQETERLARLEQSIVLQQLTHYKEPEQPNANMDLFKWAMVFLLFVAIIVAAF